MAPAASEEEDDRGLGQTELSKVVRLAANSGHFAPSWIIDFKIRPGRGDNLDTTASWSSRANRWDGGRRRRADSRRTRCDSTGPGSAARCAARADSDTSRRRVRYTRSRYPAPEAEHTASGDNRPSLVPGPT